MLVAEPLQVTLEPGDAVGLRLVAVRLEADEDAGVDLGELVLEERQQRRREHAPGREHLGPLAERAGVDVMAAEDQVVQVGQAGHGDLRQPGHQPGRVAEPAADGEGADHGGGGHRAAGADQPHPGPLVCRAGHGEPPSSEGGRSGSRRE